MEYRQRVEAEDFLYSINITHTNYCDYNTFLIKKVKFILSIGKLMERWHQFKGREARL